MNSPVSYHDAATMRSDKKGDITELVHCHVNSKRQRRKALENPAGQKLRRLGNMITTSRHACQAYSIGQPRAGN